MIRSDLVRFRPLPKFIFMSRGLWAPLHPGLVIVQGVCVDRYGIER